MAFSMNQSPGSGSFQNKTLETKEIPSLERAKGLLLERIEGESLRKAIKAITSVHSVEYNMLDITVDNPQEGSTRIVIYVDKRDGGSSLFTQGVELYGTINGEPIDDRKAKESKGLTTVDYRNTYWQAASLLQDLHTQITGSVDEMVNH